MRSTYAVYQRALVRYKSAKGVRGRAFRTAVEALTCLTTALLAARAGVRFPSRAVGGWWWIGRYRFEFMTGWYEHASTAWCTDVVRPGMTVVDVGAHIGYFTRLFSRLVGSTGHVVAFEPEPENYALLHVNLRRSRFRNVDAVNAAVSDESGSADLYLAPGHSFHSLVSGYTRAQAPGSIERTTAVETLTLDSFLAQRGIGTVDFVKVDAEGAELRVLAGMTGTIARSPHLAMLVECNPVALGCAGVRPEDLVGALSAAGFDVRALPREGCDGGSDDVVNLACVRAPRAG